MSEDDSAKKQMKIGYIVVAVLVVGFIAYVAISGGF